MSAKDIGIMYKSFSKQEEYGLQGYIRVDILHQKIFSVLNQNGGIVILVWRTCPCSVLTMTSRVMTSLTARGRQSQIQMRTAHTT